MRPDDERQSLEDNDSPRDRQQGVTTRGHHGELDATESDEERELAMVIEAWERLPAAVRAGIVAMVRSCEAS